MFYHKSRHDVLHRLTARKEKEIIVWIHSFIQTDHIHKNAKHYTQAVAFSSPRII